MSILGRYWFVALFLPLCVASHVTAQGALQPDLSGNDPHWKKLATQDCWVYDAHPRPGGTVGWNGRCVDRLGAGAGTEIWKDATGRITETERATLVKGVAQGPDQINSTLPDGTTRLIRVPMVNGVPTGEGTISAYKDGKKILDYVGSIVDGEASGQGRLTTYDAKGAVAASFDGLWAQGKAAGPGTVVRIPDTSGSSPARSPQSTYSATSPADSARPTAPAGTVAPDADAKKLSPEGDAPRGAEIADISKFMRGYTSSHNIGEYMSVANSYKQILSDPTANKSETKIAVADCFYFRGGATRSDDWLYDDKKFNDLQKSRRWYEAALNQIKSEHPDMTIGPSGARVPSDPSGQVAYLVYRARTGINLCPTELGRKQERADKDRENADKARRANESECTQEGEVAQRAAQLKGEGYTLDAVSRSLQASLKKENSEETAFILAVPRELILTGVFQGAWKDMSPKDANVAAKKWCIRNGGH